MLDSVKCSRLRTAGETVHYYTTKCFCYTAEGTVCTECPLSSVQTFSRHDTPLHKASVTALRLRGKLRPPTRGGNDPAIETRSLVCCPRRWRRISRRSSSSCQETSGRRPQYFVRNASRSASSLPAMTTCDARYWQVKDTPRDDWADGVGNVRRNSLCLVAAGD